MTILKRNDQSGRSMVEMLGVLAIIGVLSVGGISGYSKAMAKYKLTKAQDQVTMLLMNIRTAYATSPSYSGLTAAVAASYNLAPNEMVSSDKEKLYGTFGGEVEVGTVGTGSTYFYITMRALGKEACRALATSDWGADGLVSVLVQADDGTTAPSATCTAGTSRPTSGPFCTKWLPIQLSDLGTTSSDLCGSETNKITWVYY